MKKTFCLFICLIACSFAFAQNGAQKDLAVFALVKTVESGFSVSKHMEIAEKPLVSKGFFYFKSPDKLRWEYETPYSYGFLVDGEKMLSWQEKDGKKEIRDIPSGSGAREAASLLKVFISMDMETISKIYEVETAESGLSLIPKNKSGKQAVREIKILFAGHIAAVKKVIIYEKSGDFTEITFTDTKIDGTLPQNAFTI